MEDKINQNQQNLFEKMEDKLITIQINNTNRYY